MSISRIKDSGKKMDTSYHLIFLKFRKNQVTIKWITKKVKILFSLKDKNPYPAHVCDETYIGETIRMLAFNGISMRTYIRNLNLQSI